MALPATSTGVYRSVVPPSPTWPEPSQPQAVEPTGGGAGAGVEMARDHGAPVGGAAGDLNGHGPAGGGAVAHLALPVRPPAVEAHGCPSGAAVEAAHADRGPVGGVPCHLDRRGPVRECRAVTQLAGTVVAPAVEAPRRPDAAGVQVAGGDRRQSELPDSARGPAGPPPAVAETGATSARTASRRTAGNTRAVRRRPLTRRPRPARRCRPPPRRRRAGRGRPGPSRRGVRW